MNCPDTGQDPGSGPLRNLNFLPVPLRVLAGNRQQHIRGISGEELLEATVPEVQAKL
jgi:hypothetical protein